MIESQPLISVIVPCFNEEESIAICHERLSASGGRVEIVPTVDGFSTTQIVKKLTENSAREKTS
jgi:glycosyltransferase involved in cell wall biosynthesis